MFFTVRCPCRWNVAGAGRQAQFLEAPQAFVIGARGQKSQRAAVARLYLTKASWRGDKRLTNWSTGSFGPHSVGKTSCGV